MAKPKPVELDWGWAARQLENARSKSTDGGPSYTNFRFEDFALVLAAGPLLPPDLTAEDCRDICTKAMFAVAAKEGEITAKRLQSAIARCLEQFLGKKCEHFVLVTSLTLPWTTKLPGAQIDDARIAFAAAVPKFDRAFVKTMPGGKDLADDFRLLKAKVHVQARSTPEALKKATDNFDFLRGCWNLGLNMNRSRGWTADPTQAINLIRPGPYHTLHKSTGDRACDYYWYEPFYQQHGGPRISGKRLLMARQYAAIVRNLTRQSVYGDDLKQAVIRYGRALDVRDPEMAFLKLWGALEYVTDTVGGSYDETIRRICFLIEDATLDAAVLGVLRNQRNKSIHSGLDEITRELVLRLNGYVAPVLDIAVRDSKAFSSLAEYGQFLSFPTNAEELTRKAELYRRAMKHRGVKHPRKRKSKGGT